MHKQVNSIAGRLSLRPPQRKSLEILDRVVEIAPPGKDVVLTEVLASIRSEFPSVQDFEREFPSICFALATGVGKTRLMGAFITYLHVAHGVNNFFVLAPNLTIYNKLITDFTPNTPKYVFTGIAEFATESPEIITGDTYDKTLIRQDASCSINIFNIGKIASEVRGGKSPRIKRLSEYIGESYFEYLAGLPDLVLIMDESHRYRASAGVRAINELKPILGLELTATPQVESGGQPVRFKNIIFNYPLGSAIADGFVKDPAVATRRNFDGSKMGAEAVEQLKLEDGVRLHEATKVDLETYARERGLPIVKPFLLVIAREVEHAARLVALIESDGFFGGRYRGKVIQVDSSQTGAKEEEMIQRLLKVESAQEPTEIVVHVNMLKEGWDVTNLYTIVPLRAANARTLIEQSIGRGLRLPYGKRTGVEAVDRLTIVAHDRFQEIVDEARRPDSLIQMKTVILDPDELARRQVSVVSKSNVEWQFEPQLAPPAGTEAAPAPVRPPVFSDAREREVARVIAGVIDDFGARADSVPTLEALRRPATMDEIVAEARERMPPTQQAFGEELPALDIEDIARRTVNLVIGQTIPIPRILVLPRGIARSGFRPFTLDLDRLRLQPPGDDLWLQYLQSGRSAVVGLSSGGIKEARPEDVIVRGLIDFNDVSYDNSSEVLYNLAGQVVAHLRSYPLEEADVLKVLHFHQRQIAEFVHVQMQPHYWDEADGGYEVQVSRGFTRLKESAYSTLDGERVRNFKIPVDDKSNISKYLFGYFERCLYETQKFQSDPERRLAVILDRDSERWFRPAKGQFGIFYRSGSDHQEYQPDFVAETAHLIWMLEVKVSNEMTSREVLAKKDAAEKWCRLASDYAKTEGGKPWGYALIVHDAVKENMSLMALAGN